MAKNNHTPVGKEVYKRLKLHGFSQKRIGVKLGYAENSAQPAVSNALSGKNDTLLSQIIDYLCREFDYKPANFIPPQESQQLDDINNRLSSLEEKVDKIFKLMLRKKS